MLNESQTGAQLIDTALSLAGWNLDDHIEVFREHALPSTAEQAPEGGSPPWSVAEPPPRVIYGSFRSDYVFLSRGRIVAVIEAKRLAKNAGLGKEQALRYARTIEV